MWVDSACGRAVVTGMLGALGARGDSARTHEIAPPDPRVTVRAGVITAPDSVRPGWVHVRVEEAEDTHIVVLFGLPPTAAAAAVTALVAALDSAPATPSPGAAIGGPEVGVRGEVVVHLPPGVYVVACVGRGDDRHRHASRGEFRVLIARPITPADSFVATPPRSKHDIHLVDFAYVGPDHWAAGPQWLRIENTGKQDHQLRLARLRDGASPQAWMSADDPDTVATAVVGMARVSPGEVAYLPVDLTAGAYIVYCLVADVATRRPHVTLGMLRAIQVP